MNTSLIAKVAQKSLKTNIPEFRVGDTIEVVTIIRDGDKQRTQTFAGLVISRRGSGLDATFIVRKISYGVGVEKIFPLHSPNIDSIKLVKAGQPRRAKLFYLRDRVGKKALKVKVGDKSKRAALEIPEQAEPQQAEVEAAPQVEEVAAEATTAEQTA